MVSLYPDFSSLGRGLTAPSAGISPFVDKRGVETERNSVRKSGRHNGETGLAPEEPPEASEDTASHSGSPRDHLSGPLP